MGRNIVSGMSQRVTFGVRSSENLELGTSNFHVSLIPPLPLVPPVSLTYPGLRFALAVGGAVSGSSGQECLG